MCVCCYVYVPMCACMKVQYVGMKVYGCGCGSVYVEIYIIQYGDDRKGVFVYVFYIYIQYRI